MRRRGRGSAISKLEEDDLCWHDESKDVLHVRTMTNQRLQTLLTQFGVTSGQTLPHAPQLFASLVLSTHPLAQQSGVLTPHTWPHDPQLFLSDVVSLHALEQHVGEPLPHAAKHAPQF